MTESRVPPLGQVRLADEFSSQRRDEKCAAQLPNRAALLRGLVQSAPRPGTTSASSKSAWLLTRTLQVIARCRHTHP